jgi:hypothetical protein
LNPATGKMVLSGGRVGSKLIKNYTADKILNPKSKKLVMTGGKVGKNVLETYKNGYLKGTATPEENELKMSIYTSFMEAHSMLRWFYRNSSTLLAYLDTTSISLTNRINQSSNLNVNTENFHDFIYNTKPNEYTLFYQDKFLNFLKEMLQFSQNSILQNTDTYEKIIKPIVEYFSDRTVQEGKTFAEIFKNYVNGKVYGKTFTGFKKLDEDFFKNLDILIQEIRLDEKESELKNIIEKDISSLENRIKNDTYRTDQIGTDTIKNLKEKIDAKLNIFKNQVWTITNSDSQKVELTDENTRLNIIQKEVMENYNTKIDKHFKWLVDLLNNNNTSEKTMRKLENLKKEYILYPSWKNKIEVAERLQGQQSPAPAPPAPAPPAPAPAPALTPPSAQLAQTNPAAQARGGKKKRTYKKSKN